jgi:pimeloyl-ACP methyl ester carboxylesterase
MSPRFHKFWSLGPHGFHGVAYTEWGDPRDPQLVICVHGLTRNCRDFDPLAARLAQECRVVCMDVVGRGDSDWLEHKEDYGFDIYVTDAAALIARLTAPLLPTAIGRLWRRHPRPHVPRVDWIGTSMGGLVGMMLAAKRNTPIRRLVLNDVGPLVPWPALLRLKVEHAGTEARFADLAEVERHLRVACATFGPLADEHWRDVAQHSSRRLEDGTYALAFDPGIISAMRHGANAEVQFGNDFLFGVDLWPVWNAVQCPTLVIRGSESDLLLPSTVAQMQATNALARVVEFPGIGHAPWLASENQITIVRDFLSSPVLP